MIRKIILILFALTVCLNATAEHAWVRVNLIGYMPQSTKVAVYMSRGNERVDGFEIIDVYTGETVYRSDKSCRPMAPMECAATTCRLNFSDFTRPGVYQIKVNGTLSPIFPINCDIYRGTADFTLNYLRQQQCGFNPFQRDSCHTLDAFVRYNPEKEGQTIDVRGGWHDAADLLQYVPTSANTIYQLMLAYESNPACFADRYEANGLPGSNGIPDIVDQIYWGLDWLDRMNPSPGEMYNQIADDRDHIGMKMPKDDPADYGRGPRGGRPVYYVDGKPQQRGKFMNATLGAASTAGKFASDFALGSRILAPFYPAFAEHLSTKVRPAYQLGLDKPGNTQTVSVVSPYIYEEDNWVDDMELAAAELYRMTGDVAFLRQAVEYGRREPVTPWMGADSARHYQWYPFMNMGHYRIAQNGDARVRQEFIRNLRAGLERVYGRARELDHPFYWGVPGIWCSNNLTTALLTQCILYRQLTGDTRFEEMEGSLRDWLFGCNPWGTTMIVELPKTDKYPHAPHSNWTFEGVGYPTGGLVDGPVYATIFGSLKGVNIDNDMAHVKSESYLNFQPGDVVYHDNTHDYSTNEPTLDGTAALTFPLSTYEMEGRRFAGLDTLKTDRNTYSYGGITRGDPQAKQYTLVFTAHDMADGADTIISTLREKGVKGAFFLTGTFYELYPDVVKRLVADGHYVGTHSDRHLLYAPWDNRDTCLVTHGEFVADLLASYRKMRSAGIDIERARYFIPPYEWYNATTAAWAWQLGLQLINYTPGTWTNADYTFPGDPEGTTYCDNEQLWTRLMEWEREHTINGHLLLIHLGTDARRPEKFYNLLPQLIDTLTARGYRAVPLETLLD